MSSPRPHLRYADDRRTIAVDDDGILTVSIDGVWATPEVDRFFTEFGPVHAEVRRQWSVVLMLLEVRTVQSPLVALYVRDRTLALKRPGDRNAVIVATFLSRLQIKRLGGSDGFGVFTDRASARDWLIGG